MKEFTFRLIQSTNHKSIAILFFTGLFSLFSCTKEDIEYKETKQDNYPELIENAKIYFESNLRKTIDDTNSTKSVTNSLILDWESVHIVPVNKIFNLEIPILSPTSEHCKVTLYDKEREVMSGNKEITSKLIMIYNSAKDEYRYFIVSNITLHLMRCYKRCIG